MPPMPYNGPWFVPPRTMQQRLDIPWPVDRGNDFLWMFLVVRATTEKGMYKCLNVLWFQFNCNKQKGRVFSCLAAGFGVIKFFVSVCFGRGLQKTCLGHFGPVFKKHADIFDIRQLPPADYCCEKFSPTSPGICWSLWLLRFKDWMLSWDTVSKLLSEGSHQVDRVESSRACSWCLWWGWWGTVGGFRFFVWWSSALFVDVFRWFDFIDTYVNVRMIICVFVSLGCVSNAQGYWHPSPISIWELGADMVYFRAWNSNSNI